MCFGIAESGVCFRQAEKYRFDDIRNRRRFPARFGLERHRREDQQGDVMRYGCLIRAIAFAALALPIGGAQAFDESKYPDLRGQWDRFIVRGLPGQPSFDQTKPWGFGQEAPLTPEYRAVLEASLADQAKGGLGNYPTARCLAAGMPHMMIAFRPLEFVVTADTTYILIGGEDHYRRIFTDGRDWPKEIEPTYA